jgi:GT2 family glycosyltransferase
MSPPQPSASACPGEALANSEMTQHRLVSDHPNWTSPAPAGLLDSLGRQTIATLGHPGGQRSHDASLTLLARQYPEVRVIPLGENRGFARACNIGMCAARGELVVLLNNDTEADPGWLEAVVGAFARHPDAGSVASKMRLFGQRDTLHTAGDTYRLDGVPGNRGVWQRDEGQFDQELPVFRPRRHAYRRSMLDDVGLLDSVLYSCEDVDLGWRAQLAGWPSMRLRRWCITISATGAEPGYYDGRHLSRSSRTTCTLRRHWREVVRASGGPRWRCAGSANSGWLQRRRWQDCWASARRVVCLKPPRTRSGCAR